MDVAIELNLYNFIGVGKGMLMVKRAVALLCMSFLVSSGIFGEDIRLFSFNIQIFGKSKMSKPDVVSILADIVSLADIIAVQEVRSADIEPVERFMRLLPPRYAYVIGPREGRGSSKEQYWVIYDQTKLRVLASETWDDPNDIFERNPFAVFFQTLGNFDFILIDNHIQPRAAASEIRAMPRVADFFQRHWNESDVIMVGDFNADGSYFDERFLEDVFPRSHFQIVISNEYDTSVAASDNTYDRIIISNSVIEDYSGACGVLRFDELYNFDQYHIVPRDVSDHFPIYAEFHISSDTD
jgi:endonuclease/exonuclease/phosphatase family metal-dependent hydrolase